MDWYLLVIASFCYAWQRPHAARDVLLGRDTKRLTCPLPTTPKRLDQRLPNYSPTETSCSFRLRSVYLKHLLPFQQLLERTTGSSRSVFEYGATVTAQASEGEGGAINSAVERSAAEFMGMALERGECDALSNNIGARAKKSACPN